ncbi:MAG: c-type cytochrome [Pseudomonadales bacterium]
MKIFVLYLSVALLSGLISACGTDHEAVEEDTTAKEALAGDTGTESAKALAQTCATCHGAEGISTSPAWPNLAGQKSAYLFAQIKAIREGARNEPTMLPFVKDLSDEQIEALADYFSSLPGSGNQQAEILNNAGANVRARCVSCHGMQGLTVNEWPNLAGQKKEYLQKQLHAFRDGSRTAPLMNVIANELSEQQIKDVAEYYSQLAY